MNCKSFFSFFYVFLGIICIISIPTLIGAKEYKKLIIFLLILSFLLIISISLYAFFNKMAKNFYIESDRIRLRYHSSQKILQISDIDRIIATDYRYILHMKSGEKYSVTRILAPFKFEHHVDHRIFNLSVEYGIKVVNK